MHLDNLAELVKAQEALALSRSLSAQGAGDEAIGPAEVAVYFSRKAGDYDLLGRALCHLALVYQGCGLHRRAIGCLDEFFRQFILCRQARSLEGAALSLAGCSYQALGHSAKALDYFRRAYRWHLDDGAPAPLLEENRSRLTWQYLKLGQLDGARELVDASVAYLKQAPNDLEARAGCLNNLALRDFLTGNYPGAMDTGIAVLEMRNVPAARKAQACLTLHHTAKALGLTREAVGLGTLARIQASLANRPDLEAEATRCLLHMQDHQGLPLLEELLPPLRRSVTRRKAN